MESFKNVVEKIMLPVFGIVGTLMILTSTYGVFARDLLHVSAPWTDEALKLMDICMIFIVSAAVFLRDEHIALTLIEDSKGVRHNRWAYNGMKIFQYILALVINAELCRELVGIITKQMATNEITTVIQYPLWFLNMGILIGCALTVVFAVVMIIHQFQVHPEKEA